MKDLNPQTFSQFNVTGFYTLYYKEVRRFSNILTQTIFAPVITGLLFLFVFQLSVGRANISVGHLTFTQFLVPGLIIMSVLQNAFSNTSSSIVSGKMLGSVVDLIMPPLSALEIMLALTLAGITRGVLIGISCGIAMAIFTDIYMHSIAYTIVFILLGSAIMSITGILAGMWSERWDNIAAVTTYVITPMSFLSGTFYSVDRLPEMLQSFAYINPFFYMIDGFRFGMTGYSDANPIVGLSILVSLLFVLGIITHQLLKAGWRLRT